MNTGLTCAQVREHLDAFLSRELPEETSQEIARHLESCAPCAAEVAARSSVRAQVRSAVRATPVPAGLESTVRRTVRGEIKRPRTGLWAVAAAAAVIVCVVCIGVLRERANPEEAILRKTPRRLAAILNVGLRDHLQCAVFRKYSKQPEPASQMAAELGPEFAGLVPLVQARLPHDFRVIQGHRCTAAGRQYTHLIIAGGAGGGKIVSLLLTRKLPSESFSGGVYQAGVDRFQVVGFMSHGYLAYVISDLDASQNLELEAMLAPVVRGYLEVALDSGPGWVHSEGG
jgi:anti-sigma factor (TIGR02949 family)